MSLYKEATIVINGRKCTDAMAMTIRCALESFASDLYERGLGDDPTGKSIAEGYKAQIREIRTMMNTDR